MFTDREQGLPCTQIKANFFVSIGTGHFSEDRNKYLLLECDFLLEIRESVFNRAKLVI